MNRFTLCIVTVLLTASFWGQAFAQGSQTQAPSAPASGAAADSGKKATASKSGKHHHKHHHKKQSAAKQ